MAKKIRITLYGITGVGIFLLLIYTNLPSFTSSTNRLSEIFQLGSLKNFFELYNEKQNSLFNQTLEEIKNSVSNIIETIETTTRKPIGQILQEILFNFLDFIFNFILYFCNYGINGAFILYLCFHETIHGTQLSIKTTPLASLYLKISIASSKIRNQTQNIIQKTLIFLYQHRLFLFLNLVLFFLANGFVYQVMVEFIILIITYVLKMIQFETYTFIFTGFQAIFTVLYPKIKAIPSWIIMPTLFLFLFLKAKSKADYKLQKNHERLKKFAALDLTQSTFINGPPGTGKTLLNVSLSLVSEESYIEELEQKLLNYEINYPTVNFAKIRKNPLQYPEHEEYLKFYQMLHQRGTFLISNYAIYSPLFKDYAKIFDFNYMRVHKKTDIYPLEEYIIISLSEFDKEYNSHDNKKEVGEEGAATFFSTISHDLKRHTKIFVDYQLKDQVPLRIRGNSEYFITIKKREKKYPITLGLYYYPFKIMNNLIKQLIQKYELKKKTISKKSNRQGVAVYKRNDITFVYAILRNLGATLKNICDWFETYSYFELRTLLSQEGDDKFGEKRKLSINMRDLEYKKEKLYDSTFLSFSYEQKKNKAFKDLKRFTSLRPTMEELDHCNSKFYHKINH